MDVRISQANFQMYNKHELQLRSTQLLLLSIGFPTMVPSEAQAAYTSIPASKHGDQLKAELNTSYHDG